MAVLDWMRCARPWDWVGALLGVLRCEVPEAGIGSCSRGAAWGSNETDMNR